MSRRRTIASHHEEAFRDVRDALELIDRHVRASVRYSAELPGLESGPVYHALTHLSRVTQNARTQTRMQHEAWRARLAAAEETIPPEERGA